MNLPETLQDNVTLMAIAFFAGAIMLGASMIKAADRGAKQALPTFVIGVMAMSSGFYLLSQAQTQTSDTFDYGTDAVVHIGSVLTSPTT